MTRLGLFAKPLVLITGATGHVGFRTLLHALHSGYSVRIAVRSEAKAAFILARPQIQSILHRADISFVIVPDITVPHAYDQAVQGVTHIIHIASPLATSDRIPPAQHDEYFIKPAVQGTVGMLEAAKGCASVRRVVITSSIVALVPAPQMQGKEPRTTPVLPTDRVPFVEGPYETEFEAYSASKVAALQHAEEWVEKEKPSFDIVYLHPSFVIGRNELATTTAEVMKGTNAIIIAMLLGKKFGPYAGAMVHVEDVARVHIQALSASIPGNKSYILSQQSTWGSAKEHAAQSFPDAFERRLLLSNGSVKSTPLPTDTSLTESTFGLKFAGFDAQVASVVGHFLELRTAKLSAPGRVRSEHRVSPSRQPREVKISS
jgi:nucleoside-diphosphate-sugar epimerase